MNTTQRPDRDAINDYLRARVRWLLGDGGGWNQKTLAQQVGVSRAHISLFLTENEHRIGAGFKFLDGILPLLGLTKDGLDQEAAKWLALGRPDLASPLSAETPTA